MTSPYATEYRTVPMDAMEAEIRNLLADEAVRQRCNGLARKIRAGHDQTPKVLVAIAVIQQILNAKVGA